MKATSKGFSLIELMVVLAVIAIVAAIALPSYGAHIQRAGRAEATTKLQEIGTFMQRFYTMNNAYDQRMDGTAVVLPASYQQSPSTGAARYNVALLNVTPTGYTLQATPVAGQVGDGCGVLTLTNTGQRTAADAGNASEVNRCWR